MTAPDRAARTTAADDLCRRSYDAAGGPAAGVALVAVGGYGRAELAPHSDLDVVLVHDAGTDPGALGIDLWYPLWDSGWKLDHAVRSLPEMLEAASDLRVALGLLDARHLAGDPGLTLRLRTTMLADWRRQARSRLPELKAMGDKRHSALGELAHVSVPDLKEAEGGLRDAGVLKALEATWLVDASTPALETARIALLDVRDHVHELAGRATDRVAPELWEPLAGRLGVAGAEAAQRQVRSLGRRITHISRLGWRRVDAVLARPTSVSARRTPALEAVAPGIALSRGEVVLDRGTRPDSDPTLLLRAAAEAAERDVVLSPATAARLVRHAPPLPEPWPAAARDALVRLLAAGPGLLGVWETLEETGAVDGFLPEWEDIRLLPHASPVHRFTVDRHVVETCVEAGRLIRTVGRPDLLLVAALLHDIGKGERADHSQAGEPLARDAARRMGFNIEDADTVATLVRRHLLLATLATTRDPDDPGTVAELCSHVPDTETLDLLRALTEADSRAAGPAAWTAWRAGLVDGLTRRARAAGRVDRPGVRDLSMTAPVELSGRVDDLSRGDGDLSRGDGDLVVSVETSQDGATVTVLAPDRLGLLADIAGALTLVRAPVRAARAWSQAGPDGEWACSVWEVADPHLDPVALRERLRRAMAGERANRSVARRDGLAPVVEVHPDASAACSVLEIRTADRPGVVHDVLAALAELELTVRSAHVSTLGPQAVDVFYVQEVGGVRPSEVRTATAAHAVRRALGG